MYAIWCLVTAVPQVVFKLVYGPGCQTNIADFMTINSISIGKMTHMFSFYFKVRSGLLVSKQFRQVAY